MADDTAEELDSFRRKWHEEVTARSKGAAPYNSARRSQRSSGTAHPERAAAPAFHKPYWDTGADGVEDQGYYDLEDKDGERKLGQNGEGKHPMSRIEPKSALEHYERAVERESEGSLGDSLSLYRKAYRLELDAGVDRLYKNKHFPPSSFKSKTTDPNPSNASVTVPNTAHHSLNGPPVPSIPQLIASFASLSIPPADPLTEGSRPPPCPIAEIPSEILINVLVHTAIKDTTSFARLSLVCKRLAYLVATEDRIWKRVCLGPDIGFTAMHYKWTCSIIGHPLSLSLDDLNNELNVLSFDDDPFPLSSTHPTYKTMLHTRPRIRYNGCYISTVNYIRPGGATASQVSWNSPVHIVTYYRYLRFFRDGTCASLLTTTEPADVVHHLTKENLHNLHPSGLPSSVMSHALRGRWKLSGDPYSTSPSDQDQEEGILHVETEGADAGHPHPKYMYKMMLQLKSVGRGAGATRNNKLAWLGYWSYNRLTDDWSEFGLKNDKAYFWSRVKSYGDGE